MQTAQELYIEPALTDLANGLTFEGEYIAESIFPVRPVTLPTGKYWKYDLANLRYELLYRAQGSPSPEVRHAVSNTHLYDIVEYAPKELVTDEERKYAQTPIDPETDAVADLTERLMVTREVLLANMLTDTGVLTQNVTLSGTGQWNDYTNSDPIANIKTASLAVKAGSGKWPNTLIMGEQVWAQLLDHPLVVDRIKYAMAADPTALQRLLGVLFPGITRYLVGKAMYNSAVEGATDALSYIWGKHAIVAYVEPNPGMKTRTLGLSFQLESPRLVDSWREADKKGTFYRCTDMFDQQIVQVEAGYLIKNAVA